MISLYYHADDIKSILLARYKLSNVAHRGHTLTQGMIYAELMEKGTQETSQIAQINFSFSL